MKKALFGLIAVLVCASVVYADPVVSLIPSNASPNSGDTVTFTLRYDGSTPPPGLGLLFTNFNATLSRPGGLGTGTWDNVGNAAILVQHWPSDNALGVGLANPGTTSAGLAGINSVDNVILSINLLSQPYEKRIGADNEVAVWSMDVRVHGAPGDSIQLSIVDQITNEQGVGYFVSNANMDVQDEVGGMTLASATVTIPLAEVPEPVTLTLFGIGLGSMALLRRRR